MSKQDKNGPATITQVAKLAGVSTATVSRVYNQTGQVQALTRERVLSAARELGYIPNVHAQRIRRKSPSHIACIMPSVADNYFSLLSNSVLLAAQEAGLFVYLQSSNGRPETQEECLARLGRMGVDGLLFAPLGELQPDCFERHGIAHLPTVIMQRRQVVQGLPHVHHNDQHSGYIATKYLLRLKRRKILFFAGVWNPEAMADIPPLPFLARPECGAYTAFDRLRGHLKALEEAGLPFDPQLYQVTGFDFTSGYQAARRVLATLTDFDAIVCANDSVASGVLQALQEQNIKVPQQVSLIGCDDSVFATIARPMLTSIRQNPLKMGQDAVEMVLGLIRDQAVDSRVIDTQLVVRQSTAMPLLRGSPAEQDAT